MLRPGLSTQEGALLTTELCWLLYADCTEVRSLEQSKVLCVINIARWHVQLQNRYIHPQF